MISRLFKPRVARLTLLGAIAAGTLLLFVSIAGGCRRENKPVAEAPSKPAYVSFASTDCRSCHEEIFRAWSRSHHGLAHRPVDAKAEADAFVPARDEMLTI